MCIIDGKIEVVEIRSSEVISQVLVIFVILNICSNNLCLDKIQLVHILNSRAG